MTLTKRNLLAALAALAVTPALAQTNSGLDLSAARSVGQAYLAAYPNADLSPLRAALSAGGPNAAIEAARQRVRADFAAGRVFVYRGWRLSETEAQLCALLS